MHRTLLYILIVLILLGGAMTIGQMWFSILAWDTFVKGIITIVILGVLIGLLMVIKADLGQHKKLKDENYLD